MSKLQVNEIENTAGNTALTIDGNGVVSTPTRPAFMVTMDPGTSNIPHNAGEAVEYNSITGEGYNKGNHFDLSNHKFIVPIDGLYYLQATVAIATENGVSRSATIYPVIDGLNIYAGYYSRGNWDAQASGAGSYLRTSGSWVLDLQTNSEVQFNLSWEVDGNSNMSSTQSIFYHGTYATGYLIG